MALDRRFQLLHIPRVSGAQLSQEDLGHLALQLADRPVLIGKTGCLPPAVDSKLARSLLGPIGGENIAIFIPSMHKAELMDALSHVLTAEGNFYALAHNLGLLAVDPARFADGGLRLSGGSFSDVILRVADKRAVVYKGIDRSYGQISLDAGRRLDLERLWLSKLPDRIATIFPRFCGLVDTPGEFGYEMEFFPASSVAELVFQDCLDAEELFSILSRVYTVLRDVMYCHSPILLPGLPDENSYIEKIRRRTTAILESDYPADGRLRTLYHAKTVRVNGLQCPAFSDLLEYLSVCNQWQPAIAPTGRQLCHGDLILEDILLNPRNGSSFRLVDPNPANHSSLFDVAKTMLSLWIGYEFLYYDLFTIDHFDSHSDHSVEVTISLERPDCQSKYAQTAILFVDFAKRELSDYLGLDQACFESQLRMASALHALAIPMFHLFHHRNDSRALAFACLGLYHAAVALAEKSSGTIAETT